MLVDRRHELSVYLSHEHLAHELHRLIARNALAAAELHGDLVPLERGVDILTTAVDDDRLHPHDLEQHDVAHHIGTQALVHHRGAAVLDDDRLARQVLHPRQRSKSSCAVSSLESEVLLSRAYFMTCS